MKTLIVPALVALAVSLSSGPSFAQQSAIMQGISPNAAIGAGRGLSAHAINPSLSLSSPATNPLQEQTQDDYATGLIGAQRELLQQNPSGLGRQELAIGHELNSFTGPR